MNRIEAIYSLINIGDKVIDVGCDQAELGIMLGRNGISSIASDISEKVIEKAREKISELNLNNYIDLRVSNGLENIKEDEANTLVLAGMGTHTILDILSSTNILFDKIITISNNYHDTLRIKMNELNYTVHSELIIKENNKYYNLIMFIPGSKSYSEYEILLGLNHIDNKLYNDYLKYILNKYKKIQETSENKNEKINKIINLIESHE